MNKSDRYYTASVVEGLSSELRLGVQEHAQSADISLYIDGFNVGSLTPDDVKRLVALLLNRTDIDETSSEAFKSHHFLS